MIEPSSSFRAPRFDDDHAPPGHLCREPHWYACRTRARAEKKVDRLFGDRGIEAYLPTVEREREWADRTKRVAFPLFPGYVFARFELARLVDVLRTPGVATVVRTNGHPTPVREEELASVRRLAAGVAETGAEPEPVDYLTPGDQVVVIEGPFEGMRGVLVEERGGVRVAVRLDAIRQAVAVDLDRRHLKQAG